MTIISDINALFAYIGPGSGFVISFSIITVIAVILGIVFVIFISPISAAWLLVLGRKKRHSGYFRKVVILGLDGMDPKIASRLMDEGGMLNCKKLSEKGSFLPLKTTMPSLSPSVWSSFMIGNDASQHGIYDFITRNPKDYQPRLSSSEVVETDRRSFLGKLFSGGSVRMLRKGTPFWVLVGREGLEVTILRVPITFPPEPFKGRILSGMCVPDLQGTQGTYNLYSTEDLRDPGSTGGKFIRLSFSNCVAHSRIIGPPKKGSTENDNVAVAMKIRIVNSSTISILLQGQKVCLKVGQYSKWLHVSFRDGLSNIAGIVRFYLISVMPRLALYMTPVHISPESSSMPISYPRYFSDYIAKQIGPYGTLGLMEDTSALNDGVLNEEAFLEQTRDIFKEREEMFLRTLKCNRDNLIVCVFDTLDRVQHMFWRYTEKDHPALAGQNSDSYANVIDEMYKEIDRLIGKAMQLLPKKTLFLTISDHGFTSFRRSVNLNTWLMENGYMHLKPDTKTDRDWLAAVDWSRTRAYALGLTGIFINVRGREKAGIVDADDEYEILVKELQSKLEKLSDADGVASSIGVQGKRPIRRVVVTHHEFEGPYRADGPDLLVCYEAGYRCSWECAKGKITKDIICDNTLPWSGDHCVDPELVPGVLFSNQEIYKNHPGIMDIAPTVLDVFDIQPPAVMSGSSLLRASKE